MSGHLKTLRHGAFPRCDRIRRVFPPRVATTLLACALLAIVPALGGCAGAVKAGAKGGAKAADEVARIAQDAAPVVGDGGSAGKVIPEQQVAQQGDAAAGAAAVGEESTSAKGLRSEVEESFAGQATPGDLGFQTVSMKQARIEGLMGTGPRSIADAVASMEAAGVRFRNYPVNIKANDRWTTLITALEGGPGIAIVSARSTRDYRRLVAAVRGSERTRVVQRCASTQVVVLLESTATNLAGSDGDSDVEVDYEGVLSDYVKAQRSACQD